MECVEGPLSLAKLSRVELVSYPRDLPWNGDRSHEFKTPKENSETMATKPDNLIKSDSIKMPNVRQKKYSHPGSYNSPPDTPRLSPRMQRSKKHSLPVNSLTVINPYEVLEWSFFQSIE